MSEGWWYEGSVIAVELLPLSLMQLGAKAWLNSQQRGIELGGDDM